jgi:hypothetical protein
MSKASVDYIPQGHAQFGEFIGLIVNYVGLRTQGPDPVWPHIPRERLENLADSARRFDEAFTRAAADPTPGNHLRRNEAQTEAAAILRVFVNQFLRFPPVSDSDRTSMGIHNRDTIRTSHATVTEFVDFVIHLHSARELIVDFWVRGAVNKAKPRHYDGAVIIWGLRDTMPQFPEDLVHHAMASRTPFTLRFEETDRGKKAWVACCWQNERGITGAWSAYNSAIVP